MARTIREIQDEIINLKNQTSVLSDLKSNSATAIWKLWTFIVATVIWTLEKLFDTHRDEMEELYSKHHAHTMRWYTEKAKDFMYGHDLERGLDLIPFTDKYDTSEMTIEEVEKARIIVYAACERKYRPSGGFELRIKAAALKDNKLRRLDKNELGAFSSYMKAIQDAGVLLKCTSDAPDRLRQKWIIYYDPQLLDENGNRTDNSESNVVENAIRDYLKNLPFNGLYVPTFHIDYLQKIKGIVVPTLEFTQYKSGDATAATDITPEGKIADAGWFEYEHLEIKLIPYGYGEQI